MNISEPVVLGLAGGAATGKTSVADAIAPMAQFLSATDPNPFYWYHLFFAMPLYSMASIRQKIRGEDAFDRQCFALHEVLNDLFKGWISYEETVDTVYELASMECPVDQKPRTFLQLAGTEVCRSFDPDCFTKWVGRKIREEHTNFKREWNSLPEVNDGTKEVQDKLFGAVVSDARFINECQFIKDQPNGILIKFVARPDVVAERIFNRDNLYITKEQLQHQSEQELNTVPDEIFNAIIDSSDITIKEQVELVLDIVEKRLHA